MDYFVLADIVADDGWWTYLSDYGYLGLFLAAFLAATVLPLASEGLLGVMVYTGYDPNWCIVVATIGNWLGSLTTYWLGWLGKWEWLEKYFGVKRAKVERTRWFMDQYGVFSALLSWVPVIGDVIAVALGYFRVTFWKVNILFLIGKFARYVVLVYIILGAMNA